MSTETTYAELNADGQSIKSDGTKINVKQDNGKTTVEVTDGAASQGDSANSNGDASKVSTEIKTKIEETFTEATADGAEFSDKDIYPDDDDKPKIDYIKGKLGDIVYDNFTEEDVVAAIKEKVSPSTGGKAKKARKSAKKGKKSKGKKGKRAKKSAKKGKK